VPVKNIFKIIWIISLIFSLTSCSKDNGINPDENAKFVVTGSLNNINNRELSSNVRIVVVWDVPADGYGYLFGEGVFNTHTNSFTISYKNDPPAGIFNYNAFGVGYIFLTEDENLKEGIIPKDYRFEDFVIGAASQHAVIFIKDHTGDSYPEGMKDIYCEWTDQFQKGYSIGKGVDMPEPQFDSFEPADPSSVEIIIDDPRRIELVNWT